MSVYTLVEVQCDVWEAKATDGAEPVSTKRCPKTVQCRAVYGTTDVAGTEVLTGYRSGGVRTPKGWWTHVTHDQHRCPDHAPEVYARTWWMEAQ